MILTTLNHSAYPLQKIERPLSNLLSDITVSPSLATLILDSNVGEPWIEAIDELERRLNSSKARARVKAARDLGEVTEGLRIVVRLLSWSRTKFTNPLLVFRLPQNYELSFIPFSSPSEAALPPICRSFRRRFFSSTSRSLHSYNVKRLMLRMSSSVRMWAQLAHIMRQVFDDMLEVWVGLRYMLFKSIYFTC